MKIAVLIKGALRPNPSAALQSIASQMSQLDPKQHEIDTYLATWRYYNDHRTVDLLAADLFDNVIMLTPPDPATCRQIIDQDIYTDAQVDRTYPMTHVIYPHFLTKTALDILMSCKQYDYVMLTRPDLYIDWGSHLSDWFDDDHYVTPWTNLPYLNDWIAVAPPELMLKCWDYGTHAELGRMIKDSQRPEDIMMSMMQRADVPHRTALWDEIRLDPKRYS